ncbi:MAG: DUF2953 domain-containing protein [Coprococcus sp.]|nr:DUF2953 domain-containing protein [Coprococcus sp.]
MLHIIGMIFKIIGLILAGILGLLVLLILVVLFLPIRYEITASFPGRPADARAKVKFSWLCHLISGRLSYEKGEVRWRLRAFWKKYGVESSEKEAVEGKKNAHKKQIEKKPQKRIEDKSKAEDKTRSEEEQKENRKKTEDAAKEEKTRHTADPKALERKNRHDAASKSEASDKDESPKRERKSFFIRLKEKINTFFGKLKYTFRQICDKIGVLKKKKEAFSEYLEDEAHRSAFARMCKELVWVRRFLKPKKLRMDIRFGLGDPYRTGQALAALSMIYPFVGEYIVVEPDFEEKVLEGELYVKGGMHLFHMAMLFIKLVIDRNVRTLFKDTRKLLGI